MDRTCDCGSGETREAVYDGYGIFLCFVCSRCREQKTSQYRSDIFERYEADEPIEPEE